MREFSYATLMLSLLVPLFSTFANAADDSTANPSFGISPSDEYYIDSRSGGDGGQYVDQFPGASIPSAEAQMPADDWTAMSGSSLPPAAPPPPPAPTATSTKTPDWLSNPTGPIFK